MLTRMLSLYYTILCLYYVVRYHTILYEHCTIQYYIGLRLVPILVLYFVTLVIHHTILYCAILRRYNTVLYEYCTDTVLYLYLYSYLYVYLNLYS